MKYTHLALALSAVLSSAYAKVDATKATERIGDAAAVFQEIMQGEDKGIPQDLLDKAHCVAIVPGLKKGGFIVGAKYGKGVLMCRKPGGGWTGPAAVRVEGGSFGLQIGAGEVDLVMLVMNERGAQKLVRSEFKVGGAAEAMAGPVGRSVQAETDAYMRAEILSYSRSRGVFAGIALQGSTFREDLDDNEAIYGQKISNERILFGGTAVPPAGQRLVGLLSRYSRWEQK